MRHPPRPSRLTGSTLALMALIALTSLAGGAPAATAQDAGMLPDTPAPSGAAASPVAESTAPTTDAGATPVTIVMTPSEGGSVGGWREVVRAPEVLDDGTVVWLGDLAVLGDRLVSMGGLCLPGDGPCPSTSWSSMDGLTWTQGPLPGRDPEVTDTAATADKLYAVGYDIPGGRKEQGAVWSTTDGLAWTNLGAPPVREVDWVAASDDAIVVAGGNGLWVSANGTDWRRVDGPGNLPVAYGPGGFLAFGGGGQDLMSPTTLWRSTDGSEWTPVELPKALRSGADAFGGVQVFALDDRWVLVPDEGKLKDAIYVSSDGERWERAPRPPKMAQGYIWWMERIGDQVQAHGLIPRDEQQALWTWRPGEPVGKPEILDHQAIGRPVAWRDGSVAIGGSLDSPGGTALLRLEPEATGEPVEGAEASPAPAGG